MDPVNGIGQIMQILRRRLGERTSKTTRTATVDAKNMPGSPRARQQSVGAEDIKRKIGARVRSLKEDEREGPKAVQIFVESIITWELGEDLLQDPEFDELSKEVVNTIINDSAAHSRMRELLFELQRT